MGYFNPNVVVFKVESWELSGLFGGVEGFEIRVWGSQARFRVHALHAPPELARNPRTGLLQPLSFKKGAISASFVFFLVA